MILRRFVGTLALAALGACTRELPESVGPAQEILVLADPADLPALEAPLRDIFEKVVRTPQEERVFSLRFGLIEHTEASKLKERRNVLIVAPLDATHETAGLLRSLLSDDVARATRDGRSAVIWKRDVWARGQLLMVATGPDLGTVVDNLRMEADRLYAKVEEVRDETVAQLVYRYGEREDVTRQLMDDFGWQIRVPFGYRILEAKPDSGFVVLAKDEPSRWFFVYWEDGIRPDALTDDWVVQKRNEITARFFGRDRIAPGEVDVYHDQFSGKLAVVLEGLWENPSSWSGGPFKSYAFVDPGMGRFFFIDVGVFSPNKQKETYLRQLDLMAQTFIYQRESGRG